MNILLLVILCFIFTFFLTIIICGILITATAYFRFTIRIAFFCRVAFLVEFIIVFFANWMQILILIYDCSNQHYVLIRTDSYEGFLHAKLQYLYQILKGSLFDHIR
jgi:hypothetical protein